MSNHIFTGSGVALITPMKSDGSVNYDVLGDLVEFHVQNGTDAIIVQQVRRQLFRKKSIAKQFLSLQKRQTAEFLLLQVQAVTILQQPLCSQNLPQAQALTHFSA
jgi:hypothetical protein